MGCSSDSLRSAYIFWNDASAPINHTAPLLPFFDAYAAVISISEDLLKHIHITRPSFLRHYKNKILIRLFTSLCDQCCTLVEKGFSYSFHFISLSIFCSFPGMLFFSLLVISFPSCFFMILLMIICEDELGILTDLCRSLGILCSRSSSSSPCYQLRTKIFRIYCYDLQCSVQSSASLQVRSSRSYFNNSKHLLLLASDANIKFAGKRCYKIGGLWYSVLLKLVWYF